jgi:hypothetical protein
MKRREFLSLAAAGTAATLPALMSNAAETAPAAREYYELRQYHLRFGPMQKRFDDFFRDAAIPAMNRAGIRAVGVFGVMFGSDAPTFHVLVPHRTADSLVTLADRLRADADYIKNGAEFLNASPTDPGYIRVESSLMVAFDGMPKLEVPAAVAAKKSRIFELRTYESHSKKANKKKIEMFNQGEIDIFRRTGLTPVFFGEALVGSRLPNLTYLLVFDDIAQHTKNWDQFRNDPEWKKLSTMPGYSNAEILSNISNQLLRPTAYSQI